MKILIVEDEFNAREGLAAIIRKTCPQHEICGTAADGEEGCALVLAAKPDLVFVDIQLPKMNGLQMIARLREAQTDAAFVILSGYAEFDYAQQAIRYGVSEYLLKPITYDKLMQVLESMEKLRSASHGLANQPIPREEWLQSVLCARGDAKEAQALLESACGGGNLYLAGLYSAGGAEDEKLAALVRRYCEGKKARAWFASFLPEQKLLALLLNCADSPAEMEKSLNFNLLFLLRQNGYEDVTAALLQVPDVPALAGAAPRLLRLNAWGLTLGGAHAVTEARVDACPEDAPAESIALRQLNMAALACVKRGEADALGDISARLVAQLAEEKYPPARFGNFCAQYAISVLVCFKEFHADPVKRAQEMQLLDHIAACRTQTEMRRSLDGLVTLYHSIVPAQAQATSLLVKKTVDVIARTYGSHVSLEAIARQLKVTPEYLSHLFTREMGMSFSDYLKKFRIDTAKQMMQTSDLKMYQIGEKVGYKDPKYFTRMFKEVTGYSPKEYRKIE